ncbi:hypothetical protein BD749_2353 [Pontibacter ramchanderi]|uniref:Uncharacterized protein n=1 Tax=Pontibacter ramchanderi TaxID=1179743 RepID=A0A2N3UD01_9BACT|nr:hypothetical protein BD749_2353 [Pontibacter ramchanderi]
MMPSLQPDGLEKPNAIPVRLYLKIHNLRTNNSTILTIPFHQLQGQAVDGGFALDRYLHCV